MYLEIVNWWQTKFGRPMLNGEIELAVRDVLETSAATKVGQLLQKKLNDVVRRNRLSPSGLANTFGWALRPSRPHS